MSEITITPNEITAPVTVTPNEITAPISLTARGTTGLTGDTGDTGLTGATGAAGADGLGVPAGGTIAYILAKASAADNDTAWINPLSLAVSTLVQAALDLKAPLLSPTFTGIPAAPTALTTTNTTQVATTAFVQQELAAYGTGDVVGPASSTDNSVPSFDSTTGKLIQDLGILTLNEVAGGKAARITSPSATSVGLEIQAANGQSAYPLAITSFGGASGDWFRVSASGVAYATRFVSTDGYYSGYSTNYPITLQHNSFTAANSAVRMAIGTISNVSGEFNGLNLYPTINQATGTANNNILKINPTITAEGSGGTNLIWAGHGGVSQASLTNVGVWTANGFVGPLTGTASLATNIAGGLGGQIPYQSAANTTAFLANGTVGQVLTSGGTTAPPTWTTVADMVLADIQSVTGLKTFDTSKIAIKGSNTGVNTIANANASVTSYTNTIPAKTGTFAMTSDITGTNSGTNTGDQTSIVGISGTIAQFNTAISDATLATGGGTATGTNTGDNTVCTSGTATTAATVTGAAQSAITSLGTLTALTVDNLTVDGNTINANSGALNLTPASGSAIVLDGTISVDAGVVTGATSVTSTTFVGALTGNVTGNASGYSVTCRGFGNTASSLSGSNVGDGGGALAALTTGADNTGIGHGSLGAVTDGNQNTAVGKWTGVGATGSNNVFIGYGAGYNESGSYKLSIDANGTLGGEGLIYGDFSAATLKINGTLTSTGRLNIPTATPATAGAAGTAGDIAWDADYIYVCVSTNQWRRTVIGPW